MPQRETHLQTRLLRGIVLNRTEVNVEVGQFRFEVGRRVSGVYRGTTESLILICWLHVDLREFHGRYYRYSVTEPSARYKRVTECTVVVSLSSTMGSKDVRDLVRLVRLLLTLITSIRAQRVLKS